MIDSEFIKDVERLELARFMFYGEFDVDKSTWGESEYIEHRDKMLEKQYKLIED